MISILHLPPHLEVKSWTAFPFLFKTFQSHSLNTKPIDRKRQALKVTYPSANTNTNKREKKAEDNRPTKKNNWPTNKEELIRKYYKKFVKFINDIPFDNLTQNNNSE